MLKIQVSPALPAPRRYSSIMTGIQYIVEAHVLADLCSVHLSLCTSKPPFLPHFLNLASRPLLSFVSLLSSLVIPFPSLLFPPYHFIWKEWKVQGCVQGFLSRFTPGIPWNNLCILTIPNFVSPAGTSPLSSKLGETISCPFSCLLGELQVTCLKPNSCRSHLCYST